MKRDNSHIDRMIKFIRKHVAKTGKFQSHKQISEGCQVFPWQIGNRLTQLVEKGVVGRTQISDKGTVRQPKYHYFLIEKRQEEMAS